MKWLRLRQLRMKCPLMRQCWRRLCQLRMPAVTVVVVVAVVVVVVGEVVAVVVGVFVVIVVGVVFFVFVFVVVEKLLRTGGNNKRSSRSCYHR